jgi:hypothetical protein
VKGPDEFGHSPGRHAVALLQGVDRDRARVINLSLCEEDAGKSQLPERSASDVVPVAQGDD